MISHNISDLPGSQRRDIELMRQAALLVRNWKRGKINKHNVEQAIAKLDESEQVKFRGF